MLNENFAFEDLRAFAAVARLRSMSKAALALDTTQSTVSKRVQRLEQMLGLQLVDRQTRPIGLTVEGRTFQRLVGGFLESVDAMTQGARDRRQVTVASIPIFISHGLVPAVGAFRAAFPDWQVSIITAGNPSMANLLREGVADLWLTIGGTPGNRLRESSDIAMETFYESDRVLIVPKNHSLASRGISSLTDLAQFPLIARGPDTPTRQLLEDEFERAGVDYRIVLEVDDMDAVKRYVAYGLGVSVVLESMIEPEDLRTLSVISLARWLPPLQMSMATLRSRPLSEPARRFIEILKDTVRRRSAATAGATR